MSDTQQAADDLLRASIVDADGVRWVYRRVASVLERRRWSSTVWFEVRPQDFPRMSPDELRHVAAVLEGER